jgi:hypothetical protein
MYMYVHIGDLWGNLYTIYQATKIKNSQKVFSLHGRGNIWRKLLRNAKSIIEGGRGMLKFRGENFCGWQSNYRLASPGKCGFKCRSLTPVCTGIE